MIRLLLFTGFLLLVAWAALKLMQYNGDWEKLIQDVQVSGIARCLRRQIIPFFRQKVLPKAQALATQLKGLIGLEP